MLAFIRYLFRFFYGKIKKMKLNSSGRILIFSKHTIEKKTTTNFRANFLQQQ